MWNSKRSTFLIVKLKIPSRFGFTFPLLLPVLEETLEEAIDWVALWKWIYKRECSWASVIWRGLHAVRDMLNELRAQGPVNMVEINTPEAEVTVKLQ
ncbi:MAG: hypothetical protein VB084_03200 [Syntrophomonadaceae bacterium]|nr:hypothetical protein [Syntrophomonadaceae bacterium]